MRNHANIQPGDVVQVHPSRQTFGGAFMLVEEVREWGVIGYVPVPGARYYYRAEFGHLVRIGRGKWNGDGTEVTL